MGTDPAYLPTIRKEAKAIMGMLYLCATPIRNLEDITLRVLRILQGGRCDSAEDYQADQKNCRLIMRSGRR